MAATALVGCLNLGGCYTPRYSVATVPAAQLAVLHTGGHTEELVVRSADGSRVRIGPTTLLRFQGLDGAHTRAFPARELVVTADGIHGNVRRVAIANARGARVWGLDTDHLALLEATAPSQNAWAADRNGAGELNADGPALVSWLQKFLRRAAERQPISKPGDQWTKRTLGRWSFNLVERGGWSEPVDGAALVAAIGNALEIRDGIRWADLRSAEIANVSGGKTIFTTIGVTVVNSAIGVFLVAAATLGAAASLRWGEAGPRFSQPTFSATTFAASTLAPRGGGSPAPPLRSGDATSAPVTGSPVRLFASSQRRRSIISPLFAFEAGTDLRDATAFTGSLVAVARIGEAYEIGGGIRQRWLSEQPGGTRSLGGLFRIGMVFDLTAGRRLSIPLSFDLGGAQRIDFDFKINAGLRIGITRSLSIGVQPFNPLYTTYARGFGRAQPRWSFPTSIEVGWRL